MKRTLSLPKPSDNQWSEFLQKQAAKCPPSPLWRDELAGYLPRNPRKAKLFFRFASSLERLLARFFVEEMDWRTLCLALLLVLEFPEEARALSEDEKAISDLAYGGLADAGEGEKARNKRKKYEDFAPKADATRFLELCEAIRSRNSFMRGAYGLREMLTIHESPPVLTWREFDALLSEARLKGFTAIVEWLDSEPTLRSARTKAFFGIALKCRGQLLDAAAETDLEDDLKARLAEATELLNVIRSVIEQQLPFEAHEWLGLFGQAAEWTHFNRPSYYGEVRLGERDLLAKSIDWLSLDVQVGILAARRLSYDPPMRKRSREFSALTEVLNRRLEGNAMSAAVRAFEQAEGLDAFWGVRGDSPLKWMLFDPKSAFHSSLDAREKLRKLSELAVAGNQVVQGNFRTYFRMLTFAAYGQGGSFSIGDARAIVQDAEFMTILWCAAVAKPLNPRTMGSLGDDRKKVIASGIPEDALPLPDWWTKLEGQLSHGDADGDIGIDVDSEDSDLGIEE